ncbi:TPA: restriction endonuclease subunit S [Campylobacter jejuni]|nr:restriction endonuclease subunit S [Campylobacter jejuni]HDZ5086798.1 restriction endonuclease subunit S [Campylobacter jejuni]
MKIAQENLKLESIKWKEFVIGEIFEVRATLSGIDKNKLNGKKGIYPYITRSDKTNGVDSFIAKQDVYHYNEANVITIGLDTQTAFYQSDKFYTGQNIQILTYKELNKYNALFIIILLKKLMEKFSWGGNGATLARLKRGKIILPIDSNGNPDYKFMESYMKAIEKEHLEKITAYYNAKLAKVDRGGGFDLDEYKDFIKQDKLKNIQWKEFDFADIFKEIKRGKRLIKDNQIQGKIPYVSSSAFDNGIDNFINNNENVRKFNNCISLANSGSVGNAFFHSYEFVASDHITQLIQPKFNKYIYLFLIPIITRLSEKYSFNREINDKRIKREKLLLPIDFKGNPNWQFMENYIRDIEYKKINNIINCYQKKIR